MRHSFAVFLAIFACAVLLSACAFAPIPGAEKDATHSAVAGAGGR